jgi:hypothetical protein
MAARASNASCAPGTAGLTNAKEIAVWQPIETLADPTEPCEMLGAIRLSDGRYAVGEMHWTSGGWYWAGNDPTDSWGGRIEPTHWMPMPDPPEQERRTGEEHG